MKRKYVQSLFGVLLLLGIFFLTTGANEWRQTVEEESRAWSEAEKRMSEPLIDKEAFEEPNFGEVVGMLTMPSIDAHLPVVEGTHEDDLRKGVGHYSGTGYPLEETQIFLSGHRDTVFKRMGELKIGDVVSMKMPYGTFDYKITSTKIVSANDLTVIVPYETETLTISTCYPFGYIGSAPDRYIVYAEPMHSVPRK